MTAPIAIPLILGANGSGPQPTPPATLQQALITNVSAVAPDFTANLPGVLVDDIVSTDVGALVTIDQARVDAVNSVSPLAANAYLLGLLGQQFGIAQGAAQNTSVYVVFSGLAGAVLPQGTIVSDGTYQYATQSATVIASNGSSASVLAVATQSGSWAVAAGTVTTVVTSFPTSYNRTVTNPASGTPGSAAQTTESFRAVVFQNFNRVAQGVPGYIVANLENLTGVNPALVAVQPVSGGWKVICAGGDPTAMAGAIYLSVLDLSTIIGSVVDAPASPSATLSTTAGSLAHQAWFWGVTALGTSGETTQSAQVTATTTSTDPSATIAWTASQGAVGYRVYRSATSDSYTNASYYDVGNVTSYTDTGATATGTATPPTTNTADSSLNTTVTITDGTNTFDVTFVTPVQNVATLSITWNTNLTNFTGGSLVNSAAAPAIAAYVNALGVNQPINYGVIQTVFTTAISGIIAQENISEFSITMTINGVAAAPASGQQIVSPLTSDGYFYVSSSGVTVAQA